MPCSNHPNPVFRYLSSSEFQSFAFHTLTAIEIPIHLFAFYVIIFTTPSKMRSVKWAMFNLHFWSASLDVSISFLTIPYILFPTTSGYGFGFLMLIGVNPAYQTALVVAQIGITIVSIIVLFEIQYSIVTKSSRLFIRIRRSFIASIYLIAATYFVPFVYMVPEQTSAVEEILETLSSLRCFYQGPVFVMTRDTTLMTILTITKLLVEFTVIGILASLTFVKILSQSKRVTRSRATLTLQKRFFIGLLVQVTIPIIVIFLPILFFGYALFSDYFNQALNNICFLIISCHGLFSTLAILMVHEPYRRATFSCCFKKRSKKNKKNKIVNKSSSVFSIKPCL